MKDFLTELFAAVVAVFVVFLTIAALLASCG